MTVTDVFSLLGFAARSRQLVSGEEMTLRAIRTRSAGLVILSKDAGNNMAKKIADKCRYYQVPLVVCFDRSQLGKAIGKEARTAIAVTSPGFVKSIREALGEIQGVSAF
ncbi:L7Ae/L30e/S12e/Gadd45 family ribosomal protein [Ferroacidibacillus organovorans]|uniref:Ribosomal protein eL8/eL30/eS12/Gadd45 domain-containing protein n=1 Tax=Ferroacidibacillus organovorans TaxID=1765683 RepID=A0A101XPI4_9BACL|nr:ribosomal L7Ae/L30e/S12e/Gadd45 family protein [Ferroacidibacillus organovorans]KUO95036.1 hypothetical protein ATW55_11190 [Ferroacidibacillus organovorans]